ncbi:MAG: cytochrome b/b6 domain-containing protein [Deltaproteobacteria bacterium]|jgi:formate dehydrogenase subunit gamma|nr:cytochrome b/b6 domain-containing protein [Deltaproteobacteria bacterium]
MNKRMRHSLADRCMHWGNALLWLLLFFSGAGLLQGGLAPFGDGYTAAVRKLAGGGSGLLRLHIILGCVWMGIFSLYIALNAKSAASFLREIFSVRPGDLIWLRRKPAIMLLGEHRAAALGFETKLPPQGFYNMGQKAFGMLSVTAGVTLVATGLIMATGFAPPGFAGWCVTIHYIACGLTLAGLLVHLYMTLAVPEERPGLKSMFSGSVPEDYAKHHHANWE